MYRYKARLIRVVDGDTVDLEVDCGFKIFFKERFRILGIDAPETYGVKKDSKEYELGMKSRLWLFNELDGKELIIQTVKDKKGKYGRYLAEIFVQLEDGSYNTEGVGERMIRLQLASGYGDRRYRFDRDEWVELCRKMQEKFSKMEERK